LIDARFAAKNAARPRQLVPFESTLKRCKAFTQATRVQLHAAPSLATYLLASEAQ